MLSSRNAKIHAGAAVVSTLAATTFLTHFGAWAYLSPPPTALVLGSGLLTYNRAHGLGLLNYWGHAAGCLIGAALVFAVPLYVARVICRLANRLAPPRPKPFGADSWATKKDAAKAGLLHEDEEVQSPTLRVFGKFGDYVLCYAGNEPSLVIGGSRTGKGTGHVVPTLLSWRHSALITDYKGELWEITADHRRHFTHIIKFDATDPDTARWNPLFEVRMGRMEIDDVQNLIFALIDTNGELALADMDYWKGEAVRFFTPFFIHVLYAKPDDKKTIGEVYRMLANFEESVWEMEHTFHRLKPDRTAPDGLARDADGRPIPEVHPSVLNGLVALKNMAPNQKSGILGTMGKIVLVWDSPNMCHATSASDFILSDLVCAPRPVSLYLVIPQTHVDRIAGLLRLMYQQTINTLGEDIHRDLHGRDKRHTLLLMLDEFPKLGRLPFIEKALGFMTGFGFTFNLACQGFTDIHRLYGDQTSLFENTHILSASASSDPRNIQKVIERVGKSRENRTSRTDAAELVSRRESSLTTSEQEKYILSEEDVRELPREEVLLFVRGCRPIRANKIFHYEDPLFAPHAVDYFHGERARYCQKAGEIDAPGKSPIAWLGVRPMKEAPAWPGPEAAGSAAAGKSPRPALAPVGRRYDAAGV